MTSLAQIHRLRELREKAGITTYALAYSAGLVPSTLWRWESGRHRPSLGAHLHLRDVLAEMISREINRLAELHDEVQAIECKENR